MIQLKRLRLTLVLAAFVATLGPYSAFAGYYSMIHDNTNTNETNGNAIVIAAPGTDMGSVTVTRIRVTATKSTSVDFKFLSAREQDELGDLKDFSTWSCSLPGCQNIFTINGVKAGELYDMNGLQLTLPPGHRLLMYTDAYIGASDFFTIECWWNG